jgi:hypothetical protein
MNSLSIVALRLFLILGPFLAQAAAGAPITLPAGAAIELTVMRPIYADATHVSLHIAVPVVLSERIALPAGTEVLGTVETTRWRGRNGERDRARLWLDHLILPNHRWVAISGTVEDLPRVPSLRAGLSGEDVAITAFVSGAILSVLTRSAVPFLIGAAAGTTGGIAVESANRDGPVWLRRGRNFQMILEQPLTLEPGDFQ